MALPMRGAKPVESFPSMLGDSIRRRRRPTGPAPQRAAGTGPRRREFSFRWWHWLGLAVVVVGLSFLGGYVLATRVFFPPPVTAGVGVAVPDLHGLERSEAERTIEALGLEVGQVTEVAHRRESVGRVVAQEPVPEQQLRPGAQVSFAVSAGAPAVRVPPVTGLGVETARGLLETAGFEVMVRPVRTTGRRDVVVRTEPAPGTLARLPAAVTLVVNLGPEEEPVDSPAPVPEAPIWP